MTNQQIYQALSLKGRRGAKKKVLDSTGLSINMITRILKHGYPSEYEERVVKAALEVIKDYEAGERRLAKMRVEAAKERLIAAQDALKLAVV